MGMFDKFPYRNTRDLNLNWIIKKIIYLEGVVGAAVSDVAAFLSKKGGKMEGAIDMQGNRIFNVPTPAGDTDVTSKKYVDDKAGNYLPLSGGTMAGAVNMSGNKITSVADPESAQDVATKKYVDDHSGGDYLPLTGGTVTGAVDMSGNKITSVADPEAAQDVATKKYVDDHSGGDYLPLAGGTMSGAVNMGGNKITSVATPEADTDVATKKYVDDHGGGVSGDYLPLAGGTMSGAVNMGGNKITSVATPEADTDVATKKYVDDHSGGTPNSITYKKGAYTQPFMCSPSSSNYAYIIMYLPFMLSENFTTTLTKDCIAIRYYSKSFVHSTTLQILSVDTKSSYGNLFRIAVKLTNNLPTTDVIHLYYEIVKDFTVYQ